MTSAPSQSQIALALLQAVAATGLYTWSTLLLGRMLLGRERDRLAGIQLIVAYALGASALGTVFALLAMAKLAYPWAIAILAALPLPLAYFFRAHERDPASLLGARGLPFWIVAAAVAVLAVYVFIQCLAWPRGSDMTIYHLVIPRGVLWNHALVFNHFTHDAGLYYGWQLYALPAYLFGAEPGFQLCSFAAFALLILAGYRFLSSRYGDLTAVTSVFFAAAVAIGMSRESVVNNDLPLALVEIALLGAAALAAPGRSTALTLGLIGGFAVAVKLVAAATAPVAFVLFLWRARPHIVSHAALLAAGSTASLAPWLVFDFVQSGSPLPHFLLAWPPSGGYMPHYVETITYLFEQFEVWYVENARRMFRFGMEFFPVLLAGLTYLLFSSSLRRDGVCVALPTIALARTLFLLAMNGFSPVVLAHDRYNLSSYVLLSTAATLCWGALLGRAVAKTTVAQWVMATVVLSVAWRITAARVPFVDVRGKGFAHGTTELPSLSRTLKEASKRIRQGAGGGEPGIGFDVANQFLPANAVVATTAIDPYLVGRPFLQILPVSQNRIDLSLPPERIRRALLEHGATHLYLTQSSGLNVWMSPLVDKWLEKVRELPKLDAVRLIIRLEYPSGKGVQAIYKLDGGREQERPGTDVLGSLKIDRATDGTWWITWQAREGGIAEFRWLQAPGKAMALGAAATALGAFPIRMGMPPKFTLEATQTSSGGVRSVLIHADGGARR